MEYITMRNGTKVPMLGLGCYKSEEQEGVEAVKSAIEIGYRHIDTANFYENESMSDGESGKVELIVKNCLL